MGVLNDDWFVAAKVAITNSVEPALRVRSVDHHFDVDWVSQDDADRLALPIDAASRLDTSAVHVARNRSASRWPVKLIGEYVSEFQGGRSLESTDDETARYRVLKVSAVTSMKFRPAESKPIPDAYDPPKNHIVYLNDLLFNRANTTDLVGAVAYVSQCPKNLLLPDKLWRFVWKAPDTIHPLFTWYLFQTRPVRREIGNRATGTSGSMKNISKAKLIGIPTILPPFDAQKLFADRVESIESIKSELHTSLAELDALFASLQHRAFRGEL